MYDANVRSCDLKTRLEYWITPVPEAGCYLWTGTKTSAGYGQIKIKGKNFLVHRLIWKLNHGPILKNKFICHKCDTPLCCNLDHLFLGTHNENMADMVSKNRQFNGQNDVLFCRKGHEYSLGSRVRSDGYRECKVCKKIGIQKQTEERRQIAANKAAKAAAK